MTKEGPSSACQGRWWQVTYFVPGNQSMNFKVRVQAAERNRYLASLRLPPLSSQRGLAFDLHATQSRVRRTEAITPPLLPRPLPTAPSTLRLKALQRPDLVGCAALSAVGDALAVRAQADLARKSR